MDGHRYRQFFLDTQQPEQRCYEVVRTFFVERQLLLDSARRFGLTHGTIRNLVSQFRAGTVQDVLGCRNRFEFPIVKLLDYGQEVAILEPSANPFAAVVLAHLKTQQTRQEPTERLGWKVRISKSLFERGGAASTPAP